MQRRRVQLEVRLSFQVRYWRELLGILAVDLEVAVGPPNVALVFLALHQEGLVDALASDLNQFVNRNKALARRLDFHLAHGAAQPYLQIRRADQQAVPYGRKTHTLQDILWRTAGHHTRGCSKHLQQSIAAYNNVHDKRSLP